MTSEVRTYFFKMNGINLSFFGCYLKGSGEFHAEKGYFYRMMEITVFVKSRLCA